MVLRTAETPASAHLEQPRNTVGALSEGRSRGIIFMCWAFDVSIAILTPFTRRASQPTRVHARVGRTSRTPREKEPWKERGAGHA